MKEFDVFEKNIRDSLEGFNEIKPSNKLWSRIRKSLMIMTFNNNVYFKGLLIALFSILSLAYLLNDNTYLIANVISKETAIDMSNTESIDQSIAIVNAKSIMIGSDSLIDNEFDKSIISLDDNVKKDFTDQVENKSIKNKSNKENSLNKASLILDSENDVLLEGGYLVKNKIEISNTVNKNTALLATTTKHMSAKNIDIISAIENNDEIINADDNEKSYDNSDKKGSNVTKSASAKLATTNINSSNINNSGIKTQQQLRVNEIALNNYYLKTMPLIEYKFNSYNVMKGVSSDLIYMHPHKKSITYNYELFTGGILSMSSIYLNPDNMSDNDLDKSSLMLDYYYGGNLNVYRNNWFIRLGVNYSNYTEKFNYNTTSENIDSTVFIYYLVNNSYVQTITGYNVIGLDSIPIYGQTSVETTEENSNIEYDTTMVTNKYLYKSNYSVVNIPLIIGREFDFESFVITAGAGLSYSRIINNTAYVLDPINGEVLNIDKNSKLVNRNIFNGVINIDAGFKYDRSIIFLRTELYTNLNTIFDKQYLDKHQMYQLRLSAGVRFIML